MKNTDLPNTNADTGMAMFEKIINECHLDPTIAINDDILDLKKLLPGDLPYSSRKTSIVSPITNIEITSVGTHQSEGKHSDFSVNLKDNMNQIPHQHSENSTISILKFPVYVNNQTLVDADASRCMTFKYEKGKSSMALLGNTAKIHQPNPDNRELHDFQTMVKDSPNLAIKSNVQKCRERRLNRDAAIRYRNKKRGEWAETLNRTEELKAKNDTLRNQIKSLMTEISFLKKLMSSPPKMLYVKS